ncbi:MAG: CoA transferase, partial [Dehalococcoidia bacterium]
MAAPASQPLPAPAPPWAGLRVLDLTTEMGALAVRLLSGLGARVTRVVPPSGDPLARRGPFAIGADGEPVSLPWLHLNAGRETVELDLKAPVGRVAFLKLLGEADVLIESQPPGAMAKLGLDYPETGPHFPKLIWTSITPFGRTGPAGRWAGTDLIGMAAGGLLSLCGDPDRAPLRPSVEQGYVHASLQGLVGTLVALHARELTGRGQLVDVSMQEAIACCLGNARLFYEFQGLVTKRAGGGRAYGATGSRLVYPCADGHVAFGRTPDAMAPLAAWMRETGFTPLFDPEEWAKLPQSGPGTPGPEKARELEASVVGFFATRKKMALYEEGQARGIMLCPVSNPADLLTNAQLLHREYFERVTFPELGRPVLVPGAPVRMAATPWLPTASLLTSTGEAPARPQPPAPTSETDSRRILEGLRVADFSWVGVGPLSTQTLAWLGAEVIRVESSTRYDVFRTGGPQRGAFPDASAYFANCNRDKQAITLNLKHPRAREAALRLAAASDVLVESFTPGFLDSVGLSYDDVRAVNPSIIYLSCSMEGAGGP